MALMNSDSSQEFLMTPSVDYKGSVFQTSSGPEEFDSFEPAQAISQGNPMEPLPGQDATSDLNVFSEPEVPAVIVPEKPNIIVSPPEPVYKAGTVIRRLATFEHGSEASSHYDREDMLRPLAVPLGSSSVEPEASTNAILPEVEHDDEFFQMFITGQLPPGTVTHFSSTYDHGMNAWTDIGFEWIPSPPPPPPVMKAPVGQSKVPSVSKIHTKVSQDPKTKASVKQTAKCIKFLTFFFFNLF
ncbi:hypothetical protein ACEWY4_016715 [Coilia grayii]|uniref:Uncharacterized protein n=1 Tax=Coilia grayii TaxID=363190 RepID=A0ABD1JL66_9TELE